jgi:hypothetical protein
MSEKLNRVESGADARLAVSWRQRSTPFDHLFARGWSDGCPGLLDFRSVSVADDLRQRLLELRSRLSVLLVRRERASGAHSFARYRQAYGVTHHDADKMEQFGQDEVAGDDEMTEIRREIMSIDDQLESEAKRQGGLTRRVGRALRLRRR